MSGLDDELKEFEKETGATVGGSNFFRFKEGSNVVRILVQPKMVGYHWYNGKGIICVGIDKGCPHHENNTVAINAKGDCYVLTRDGNIQLVELPASVVTAIVGLQKSESWGFKEYPMPYSIDITVKGAGTQQAKYQVIPNPPVKLPDGVMEKLGKLKPIADYVADKKKKQSAVNGGGDVNIGEDDPPSLDGNEGGAGSDEIDPSLIPF